MSCCCPCSSLPKSSADEGIGCMKKYGDTNLYVTGPPTAKAGIIALPEIFGLDSGRIKSDADRLGKLGYAVVLVDLADGDYVEVVDDTLLDWIRKFPFETHLSARVKDAINYLKNEAKVERMCSYGCCWGAWVGACQSATSEPVILGHVSMHPSWILQNAFFGEGQVEELAKAIKVPQLLLIAGDDPEYLKRDQSVHTILKSLPNIGNDCDVHDFPDMNHGWVTRGDLNDPATRAAVLRAWHELALPFIKKICPID